MITFLPLTLFCFSLEIRFVFNFSNRSNFYKFTFKFFQKSISKSSNSLQNYAILIDQQLFYQQSSIVQHSLQMESEILFFNSFVFYFPIIYHHGVIWKIQLENKNEQNRFHYVKSKVQEINQNYRTNRYQCSTNIFSSVM